MSAEAVAEAVDVEATVAAYLANCEGWQEGHVLNLFRLPAGGEGRRTIWSALQQVREEHGIDFVPYGGGDGHYVRATPKQRVRRVHRFLAAARRKALRALAIGEARPAGVSLAADETRRLESAAAKAEDMVMLMEMRAREGSKKKPSGI